MVQCSIKKNWNSFHPNYNIGVASIQDKSQPKHTQINMGSFSYGPKYYNPNWSQYSHKRKMWEANQKRKSINSSSTTNKDKKGSTQTKK